MNTRLYVLNLSDPLPAKRLQIVPGLSFGGETKEIPPDQIPDDAEPLILYILGHAIPDAVVAAALKPFIPIAHQINGSDAITEDAFADFVKEKRGDNKTVLIWDLCFARSFEEISKGWVGKPYVHIFSCEAYEQSWHTGDSGTPPRTTLFSMALKDAIHGGFNTWKELEDRLRARLGDLQRPGIAVQPLPAEFGLAPDVPASKPAAAPTASSSIHVSITGEPQLGERAGQPGLIFKPRSWWSRAKEILTRSPSAV